MVFSGHPHRMSLYPGVLYGIMHIVFQQMTGSFIQRSPFFLSAGWSTLAVLQIFFSAFFPASVVYAFDYGVEPGTAQHTIPETIDEIRESEVLGLLWGEPGEDTIMLGMWSYHFVDNDDSYQTNNQLLAVSYKGYYAGTFINSHDNRTWSLGVERDIYRAGMDSLAVSVGYRAGIMYGYETMQIFETKLFPLFQVYTNLSYKWVGVQLTWAGSVVTSGFVFKF